MNSAKGFVTSSRRIQAHSSPAAACPRGMGLQGHLLQRSRRLAAHRCCSEVELQAWSTQDTQLTYTVPFWHPKLYRAQRAKGEQLRRTVEKYYNDVWNSGNDCLDEIATPGVVYADVFADVEDCFGRSALRAIIKDFRSVHPLLRYQVDDVVVDEDHDTVVAHYTAVAAHLLPSRDGIPATGYVSTVQGMDKFRFDSYGHCSSIESYRQRFADEEPLHMMD